MNHRGVGPNLQRRTRVARTEDTGGVAVFVLTFVIGSLAAHSPGAQLPAPDPVCRIIQQKVDVAEEGVAMVHEYLSIVTLYRKGFRSRAIEKVALFESSRLQDLTRRLDASWQESRYDWSDAAACVEASAALHTEVAVEAMANPDTSLPQLHFETAWELTRLIDPEEARRSFQRDWLLGVGLYHQKLMFVQGPERRFVDAQRYLEESARRFPADGEVLLAAGALYEWAGSLRRGEQKHLERAEDLYRRALEANPSHVEMLLRLGRVLVKQGKESEARPLLDRTLALSSDPRPAYRAHMELGGIAERAGDLGRAADHYRSAVDTLPDWQVAYIALSHCLHRAGNRRDAQNELRRGFTILPTEASLEGWWSYELGLSERAPLLFDRLRERALR